MLAVRIDVDGTVHDALFDQHDPLARFPEGVTFVGSIPSLDCVAIAGTSTDRPPNAHAFPHVIREPGVRGDIYIVGSDEDGAPVPVDARAVTQHLLSTTIGERDLDPLKGWAD